MAVNISGARSGILSSLSPLEDPRGAETDSGFRSLVGRARNVRSLVEKIMESRQVSDTVRKSRTAVTQLGTAHRRIP